MDSNSIGVVFMSDFETALLLEVVSHWNAVKLSRIRFFCLNELVLSLFNRV